MKTATKSVAQPGTLDEGEVTNGGADVIEMEIPYRVRVQITGSSDILLHRWNPEAVDEKARAKKNSAAKKSDNIESYVYRDDAQHICLPGEYLRQSVCNAAKFRQDPRSPRKSAMDLYKAGVQSLTMLAPFLLDGKPTSTWHYEDRRRAVVQRNGINRTRPAFRLGWQAEFDIIVLTPEYISPTDLHSVMSAAGLLVGVGDFRPTYGRFNITSWELLADLG
jgi:hypothetical protein